MLKVSEIFGPTIQGEGAMTGRVTYFVRLGGCDYRCRWCDSLHAVLPCHSDTWREMSHHQVVNEVLRLAQTESYDARGVHVTLSGGNPALQDLAELLDLGHLYGMTFAMETQGSIAPEWLRKLDQLILSPKPPSSRMKFKPVTLERCLRAAGAFGPTTIGLGGRAPRRQGPELSLKVVVMDRADFDFAKAIHQDYARPLGIPFFITPGNLTPPSSLDADTGKREHFNLTGIDLDGIRARTEQVIAWCAAELPDASIIPQVHTLLWGNRAGV